MKIWPLLTAALWITGALCGALPGIQDSLKCDPEKQYERHGQCCNKCPPGTYMKAKCTPSANTTCHPCGPNGYMSVWNEDLSCTRFMVCDEGKALRTSFKGNRTYPRECECIDGFHFDTKHELCEENSKCPLGSGVQLPVQSNKNTVCTPCPMGYYSNTSSATEACTQWTNCTDVGLLVIVPGTNISDAKCDRHIVLPDLTKVVILIIFAIVATGIVMCIIYIVYFRKKYSTLNGQEKQSYDQVHESQEKVFSEQIESKHCILKVPSSEEHNPLKESVAYQGRLIPMEDEYMDQRKSPGPENGSMVAGTDSTSEIGSLGTFYGFSDTSSDRLLPPSQEEGVSIPLYSHHHCGQSAKEIQDNCARGPVDNMCSRCASQQTFNGFSQATHPTSEKNDGEEPCFCFTDRQYSRSESSGSRSSNNTDLPSPPSGNVTGNHNTTVISTAPVMNIKTDLVVVYYNSASQETPTVTENVDTMRQPTQEESQSHYESFVANTQPPRYTDISDFSVSDMDSKMFAHQHSSPDSLDMFSQEQPNIFFSPNTNFLPVQEEGKPEFYL